MDGRNVLGTATPWDLVAEGYAEVTMKLFQGYSDRALEFARICEHTEIVDIACGPGTLALAAAKKVKSVKAIDFSEGMLSLLRKSVNEHALENIELYCGDGQYLPYCNESFDAAFSIFGLMYFPDRKKGHAEIFRTLKPGGKVVLASWAPVSTSQGMSAVFGAIRAMNPQVPEPQVDIESLEDPAVLQAELIEAGFRDVEVHAVTQSLAVDSIETFWDDMVKGIAPLAMMKKSLPEDVWALRNQIGFEYLERALGGGPTTVAADAWFGVGCR